MKKRDKLIKQIKNKTQKIENHNGNVKICIAEL